MREKLRKLIPYIGIAILLLSPIFVSAQSAPLQSAGDDFLASLGSLIVHFLGTIHFLGNVDFGSVGLTGSGAAVPTIIPGTGWNGPTAQPANEGSSGSFGYNDDVIAGWDAVPYQLVSGTFQICVVAFHNSGVSYVSFAVDGGSWVNVYTTTTTGASPGVPEYCANATDTSFPDGQHEFRAIVYPNVGIPRVLQSSATVSATGGSPFLSQPAHGQTPPKAIVLSGGSSVGFPNGTYYISWAGFTGAGYDVSTVQNPAATTITIGSPTVINQTNAYTAGQPLVFVAVGPGFTAGAFPIGLSGSTVYYVLSAGLSSSNYEISTSVGGTPVITSGSIPTGQTYTAYPTVVATGSGSFTTAYLDQGTLEKQVSIGGSLFLNTNAHGHMAIVSKYVSTTGIDNSTCGSSGSPCATIHQAVANLVAAGGSVTESTAGDGCALFTRTSHGFSAGNGVVLSGTLGTNFTLEAGSLSTANQLYWVISDDLTANAFAVSATPGGQCIQSGGTFSSVLAAPDVGNDNVYLDAGTTYPISATTENFTRNALEGYLNIGPAPGVATSSVAIGASGSSNGIRTNKVHLTANVITQTVTLTTNADSPSGQNVLNFAADSLPSNLQTGWAVVGGAACAPTGVAGAEGDTVRVTALNNSTGAVTISSDMFNDCPTGTVITFAGGISLGEGYDIWMDGSTMIGPGAWYPGGPLGGVTDWTGGIFFTNDSASEYQFGFYPATFSRGLTAYNLGAVSFNDNDMLLNSTAYNIAADLSDTVTTNANSSSGTSVLYFAPDSLPANISVGWVLDDQGASACNIADSSITAFDPAASTITINTPIPSGCVSGTAIVIGTGFHTDWQFDTGGGNNEIVVNSTNQISSDVEGYFQQARSFFDMALVNSSISIPGGDSSSYKAILLESPLVNGYFAGNYLYGGVDFRSDINFSATDVVFNDNTCVGGPIGSFPGVTVENSPSLNPC